jgi:hypothetical protein
MPNLPLFRRLLGEAAWQRLAPAVRRHYDLCPEGTSARLRGVMEEIRHAPPAKPWLLVAGWFKALVPYQGRDVPTEVRNWTEAGRPDAVFWHRVFRFADGRATVFASRMERSGPLEVIEFLRFGVGVRMAVSERDGALVYTGQGHCWRLGRLLLGIPDWLLLGQATVVESAVSDREVRVDFELVHPLWGRTFGYRGRFRVEAED